RCRHRTRGHRREHPRGHRRARRYRRHRWGGRGPHRPRFPGRGRRRRHVPRRHGRHLVLCECGRRHGVGGCREWHLDLFSTALRMPRLQRRGHQLVAVMALVAGLSLATPAWAYHNDDEHITDDTAHTLRDGELRIGLWKIEYAVVEPLDLGTYIVPWFLVVPSCTTKWEIWHNDAWSLALKGSLFWMDLTRYVDTVEAKLWV